MKIHNLDFEVLEDGSSLSIIPHAEQVNAIKTLPFTTVDLREEANGTKVVIRSKMRKLDSGGPQLIVIFTAFLLIASFSLLYVGGEKTITYTMLSIAMFILVVFSYRMQIGYFDYVRKIRQYVKNRAEGVSSDPQQPAPVASMMA
ncbi:MAG: hypothetical protein V4649_09120 [Bacteroidota bacterium]